MSALAERDAEEARGRRQPLVACTAPVPLHPNSHRALDQAVLPPAGQQAPCFGVASPRCWARRTQQPPEEPAPFAPAHGDRASASRSARSTGAGENKPHGRRVKLQPSPPTQAAVTAASEQAQSRPYDDGELRFCLDPGEERNGANACCPRAPCSSSKASSSSVVFQAVKRVILRKLQNEEKVRNRSIQGPRQHSPADTHGIRRTGRPMS